MAGTVVPLYGVPIHQCIERGDHDEMRKLAAEAAAHLSEVSAALEKLLAAINSSYGDK
jgi:hypothetical protein